MDLLGHDGEQPVEELGLVLRLDLDDVGVPVVQQVARPSLDHRLLERLVMISSGMAIWRILQGAFFTGPP